HAAAAKMAPGRLALRYRIEGDLERLRIPPRRTPAPRERLWQHLCCEVFVAPAAASAWAGPYSEFNFAPSGEWAAYAFERYREGSKLVDEALDPHVTVRRAAGKLELDALIHLDGLSSMYSAGKLALTLSAIIEDSDGSLSYWALA